MINFRKTLILSLWLLLCCPFFVSAKERIVLITTIDFLNTTPGIAQWYNKSNGMKMEKVFREQFKNSQYNLQVKHLANQYDVWQILRSPENAAVFIMAHGGLSVNAFDPTKAPSSIIVDRAGFNMTPVFQGINPNLKFLGLLGCYSSGLFDQIKNSSLVVKSVEGKILAYDWVETLREMMKASLDTIGNSQLVSAQSCQKSKGYELKIVRKIPSSDINKAFPAVRVEVDKKVLAVFPPANPGDVSEHIVFIPKAQVQLQKKNLRIILTTGANGGVTSDDLKLGEFEFYPTWDNAEWLLQTDNNGVPIGVTQQVHDYIGALEGIEATEYSEFNCTQND